MYIQWHYAHFNPVQFFVSAHSWFLRSKLWAVSRKPFSSPPLCHNTLLIFGVVLFIITPLLFRPLGVLSPLPIPHSCYAVFILFVVLTLVFEAFLLVIPIIFLLLFIRHTESYKRAKRSQIFSYNPLYTQINTHKNPYTQGWRTPQKNQIHTTHGSLYTAPFTRLWNPDSCFLLHVTSSHKKSGFALFFERKRVLSSMCCESDYV